MKKSPDNAWRGNPYKRPGSPFWSYVFKDASGVVRRRSAKTKDLRIAREQLAATLREIEQKKAGHVDRFAESRKTPIGGLVDEFKRHLEAEGRTAVYVKAVIRQIRGFVAFAAPTTIPSIHLPDVERFLDGVREQHSTKTVRGIVPGRATRCRIAAIAATRRSLWQVFGVAIVPGRASPCPVVTAGVAHCIAHSAAAGCGAGAGHSRAERR